MSFVCLLFVRIVAIFQHTLFLQNANPAQFQDQAAFRVSVISKETFQRPAALGLTFGAIFVCYVSGYSKYGNKSRPSRSQRVPPELEFSFRFLKELSQDKKTYYNNTLL